VLLIKNGTILTMAGITLEKGCILIDQGKIIEVAQTISTSNEVEQVIDATGLFVMPGIIEAHCHVGISEEKRGTECDDANEITTPVTPYLRALDAINPMDAAFHNAIQAGITSIMVGPGSANVVGGQFLFMKTHGNTRNISSMVIKEPAAMKISFGENPKNAFKELGVAPSTRMAIAALLREELFRAKQYKQDKTNALYNNQSFKEDFKLEPWLPVLDKKIPLKAHIHRTDDILTVIRIAKEFDLNLTLDHCTEGHLIVEEIKKSGYPAIVGPSMASRNKTEVVNTDFKTAGILASQGVLVAITTDHPVILIQYLPICAGLAAKKGLGIEEGLKAITINPAKICGVSDRVGSIEVGKDADIAIFTGNPMETFTHTAYTIIDGEIIYNWADSRTNL
jgi:imidazolonepropionase-like amidohydrolase